MRNLKTVSLFPRATFADGLWLRFHLLNSFCAIQKRNKNVLICFIFQVLHYAVYLYDAVYLYALALNKTFSNGQDARDGTAVLNNIKQISFESKAFSICKLRLTSRRQASKRKLTVVSGQKGK